MATQRFWQIVRGTAYAVLVVASLGAVFLAVFYAAIWVETARSCIATYFRDTAELPAYTSSLSLSWNDLWSYRGQAELFAKLDISSVSAAVFAGFFLFLAAGGLRNTLWLTWRDHHRRYFRRRYDGYYIFPAYFDRLCVRLGLLGTLLSFLLAAIVHLAPGRAAAESSKEIFLLLCASLSSTFVGCAVAYLLVPAVDFLNDLATGQYPAGADNDEGPEQRLVGRIESILHAMDRLDESVAAMASTATHFNELSRSMAASRDNFILLIAQLETATHHFRISSAEFAALRSTLIPHLEHLAKLPERFVQPLDRLQSAAAAVETSATSSHTAFAEIERLAKDTTPTVTLLGKVIQSSLSILTSVEQSLTSLGASHVAQSEAVRPLPDLFRSHRVQLESINERLERIAGRNGSPDTHASSLLDLQQQLEEVARATSLLSEHTRQLQQQQSAMVAQLGTLVQAGGRASSGGMPRGWRLFRRQK